MNDREFLQYLQSQIAVQLGTPVPTPVPTPIPTPIPKPPPSGDNPFIFWHDTEHLSLIEVLDYRLHVGRPRKLTEEQWAQAEAAGYKRSDLDDQGGDSGQAPYDSWSAEMNWSKPGLLYYLRDSGSKFFTIPPGYMGEVYLENVANTSSTHQTSTATVDGGFRSNPMGGTGGQSHALKVPSQIQPGRHEYHVDLSSPGGCTIVLRHAP